MDDSGRSESERPAQKKKVEIFKSPLLKNSNIKYKYYVFCI